MTTLIVTMTTIGSAKSDEMLPVIMQFIDGAEFAPEKLEKLLKAVHGDKIVYCGDLNSAPESYRIQTLKCLHSVIRPHHFTFARRGPTHEFKVTEVLDKDVFEYLKQFWSADPDNAAYIEIIEKALQHA
jgi:hypothetical protein